MQQCDKDNVMQYYALYTTGSFSYVHTHTHTSHHTPVDRGWATGSPLLAKEHAIDVARSTGALGGQQSHALSRLRHDLGAGGGARRLIEGRERPPPTARGSK